MTSGSSYAPRPLDAALQLLNSGQANQSQHICEQILESTPSDPTTLHVLALSLRAQGHMEHAESTLGRALEVAPTDTAILNTYGVILMGLGKLEEAVSAFRKSLAGDPRSAPAHSNIGHCYAQLQRPTEAEQSYRTALRYNPTLTDAAVHLALLLRKQAKLEQASEVIYQLGSPQQSDSGVLLVAGLLALDGGDAIEAESAFLSGLKSSPQSATLWGNLGLALAKQGKTEEAQNAYERAISIEPHAEEIRMNLADLFKYKQPHAARTQLHEVISLSPNHVAAWDMTGFTWFIEGDLDAAMTCYDRALAINPAYTRAAFHKSGIHFIKGELTDAWSIYRNYYTHPDLADIPFTPDTRLCTPDAEINERTVIWTDQGVGDQILQLSLVADQHKTSSSPLISADTRMIPLIKRSFPKINCFSRDQLGTAAFKNLGHETHIPAILLAERMRRSFRGFPDRPAYLVANPIQTQRLQETYRDFSERRPVIGISWKSLNAEFGAEKSLTLKQLTPLLEETNWSFVALQYGDVESDLATLPDHFRHRILLDRSIDPLSDLDGFASQVAATDAVVTTSNTTAHMAGALGVPTWTLVPKRGMGWLWYWFDNRSDNPWYPTLRVHRQDDTGSWTRAITRATTELRKYLDENTSVTTN